MNQIAIKHGSIYGGAIFTYSMITFFWAGDFKDIDLQRLAMLEWLGYARYLLMLIGMFMVVKESYQQESSSGFLTLLKPSALAAVVIALFVGVMESAYILMNPDFLKNYLESMTRKMVQEGKSAEQIAQFAAEMKSFEWMQTPLPMGAFYFVETLVVCLVLALILIPIIKWRFKATINQA